MTGKPARGFVIKSAYDSTRLTLQMLIEAC